MKKLDKKSSWNITIGLIVGLVIGVLFNLIGEHPIREFILKNIVDPLGNAFLRALFMIVLPIVLSSLIVGIYQLGSGENLRKLGGKLIAFYMATTLIAVLSGQFLVSTFQPGAGVSQEFITSSQQSMVEQVKGLQERSQNVNKSLWPGLVDTVIPRNVLFELSANNMLAIIFVAIIFGIALLSISKEKAQPFYEVCESVSEMSIKIVGWVMKLAPYAVAALMVKAVSNFGVEILASLAKYVGVVMLGFAFQLFGVYSLALKFLVKMPIREFYKKAMPIWTTAFSTSSSNATIPMTIRTLEENFKVPRSISNFSVPLGATINMDGTALFEMVAAIFVAQVFGIELTMLDHVTLVLLIIITSIGVAGVPGGSIPLIMSAMAMIGIPPEGIALVLGVDRLLDMMRTTVNVTGDTIAAIYVSKTQSEDQA